MKLGLLNIAYIISVCFLLFTSMGFLMGCIEIKITPLPNLLDSNQKELIEIYSDNERKANVRTWKLRYCMYLKLLVHFMQCLVIIIIYELPVGFGLFSKTVGVIGADPKPFIDSLECILGQYVDDTFYFKVLVYLILPYFFAFIIFIIWACFNRKKVNFFIIPHFYIFLVIFLCKSMFIFNNPFLNLSCISN